ncbi:DUF4760 domain-containing protein [Flagellimonas sp. 2504JD1-5]
MNLNDILAIFQVIGIFAVLYGIVLGIKQLKLDRQQRRDLAVMECARSFEDSEFTEAYRLLADMEPNLSREEIFALGDKYEAAIIRVGMKFETIGLLVYKDVVPIDAIEDLVGGVAILLWDVLGNFIEESREQGRHPTYFEWFHWLVDRLKERGRFENQPSAYMAHIDWKPKI